MLPMARALANPQAPALREQDRAPRPASPGDTEAWRLRFRRFQYRVAGGPHRALGQLWMLCRQWLRPESQSKEQMLELLVLEQFLGALPSKMRTWVQSQGPRNCREAASLVEDLTQMSQQEVLVCLTDHQEGSINEEEDAKTLRCQREPYQALELGLPQEGEWLQPAQPQRSPHTRVGAEASCTLGSLGLQPPSMKADRRRRTLQHEVPSAGCPGLGCWSLKPGVWDEPPCGQVTDRALKNRHCLSRLAQGPPEAEGGAWQAGAAPRDPVLQGTGGQGPAFGNRVLKNRRSLPRLAQGPPEAEGGAWQAGAAPREPVHPRPQPSLVAGLTLPRAQSSNPPKRRGRRDASSTHLPLLKDSRASPEEAGQPAVAPSSSSLASPPVPSGTWPFACAECGEVFTWVTHFMEHQKRHLEEGPFPCPECGKIFLHASVLGEHRKIHLLEPRRKRPRPGAAGEPAEADPREAAAQAQDSEGGWRGEPSRLGEPSGLGDLSGLGELPGLGEPSGLGELPGLGEPSGRCETLGLWEPLGYLEAFGQEGPFECGVCGKAFPWMVHLLDHQKLHADE